MKSPHAIDVQGLTLEYGRWGQIVRALDGLDLRVERGEWVLVLGNNGSGKSSLLRCMSGLLRYIAGTVHLLGQDLREMSSSGLARTVFLVRQDPLVGTVPDLTILENLFVADPARRQETHRSRLLRYQACLEDVGLEAGPHQLAGTLSGGQRQLLAFALARLREVPILLLDEPLAALDPNHSLRCLTQIRALHEMGTTVVQVTHDRALIAGHEGRSLVLAEGRAWNERCREGTVQERLAMGMDDGAPRSTSAP